MEKQNLSFYERNNYNTNNFWKPGMPITEEDLKLLEEVKVVYHKQGYVPSKKEISNVKQLKARFRTWGNVLCAVGLPSMNNPDEQRKRQKKD